jgi:hypothetical protein
MFFVMMRKGVSPPEEERTASWLAMAMTMFTEGVSCQTYTRVKKFRRMEKKVMRCCALGGGLQGSQGLQGFA